MTLHDVEPNTRPGGRNTDGSGAGAAARTLTLVVPMRNEAVRFTTSAAPLARFIGAQPAGSEIVFVDDGSTDATVEVVERFLLEHPDVPARLVRGPARGKGAALRTGLASARTALAAYCDADLSTPLADLARIVDVAARAPVLAIGSRDLASSRITRHQERHRELLGKLYNRAVQLLLVPGVVDTQCGAKAARTDVWARLLPYCTEDGFAWDVEAVALARAFGIDVQEIGIEWRHEDGSQVRPMKDGLAMLRALPRIRRQVASTMRDRADGSDHSGPFVGTNAEVLADADATHWWFRSKAALVSWVIRHHTDTSGLLLDVGAGSAGVTATLGWAPEATVAVDASAQLVRKAKARHSLSVVQSDCTALPVAGGSARVVCLLDVIEHLPDPGPTLDESRRVLAHDGLLVVNVPGHPRLWSSADEVLGHQRRYTRAALHDELARAGLDVVWMSHVFSWLFVPLWLKRRARPGAEPQLGLEHRSAVFNVASLFLARLEWAVVARRPLPVGTSVLCAARRSDAPST